jgi:amino acid transporter
MYPGAGGLYTFLRQAYGNRTAFLYTWAGLLMINSGASAVLAVAFSIYSAQFLSLGAAGQKVVAVGVVLLLSGVNCLGVRAGKWVQNIFTLAKVGGITAMCAVIFAHRAPLEATAGNFWPGSFAPAWTDFGIGLVAVLWAFDGWFLVSFMGAEMKNPVRDLPRALFYGMLIITAVYLLASTAYYSVLTVEEVAGSDRVAAEAMLRLVGPIGAGFVSLLILISIFGALNGNILASPRCYYAMAADGLFFGAFARIHPRAHTPVFAILIQGVWSAVLALIGTFQQLFTAVIFTVWIFYAAVVAAVIVLRWKQPERERPFMVPGYPWVPGLFCLAATGIVVSAFVSQPAHVRLAFVLILSGLPVYGWLRRTG